jgi:quercetin dioxygenase-like cupin family protein
VTSTADPMEGRVARFSELRRQGTPLAFIDSVLPGHLRMNYAVVGDTAVEDPEFRPALTEPHRFQVGLFEAPPGNGPGWHTHEYVELFVPLTGRWAYRYGHDPEGADEPEGEILLDPWDAISFPPGLWRSLANVSQENAWSLAVLDPHDPFVFKDPVWPESTVRHAAEMGVSADERGRMIKPENHAELEDLILRQIYPEPQLTRPEETHGRRARP